MITVNEKTETRAPLPAPRKVLAYARVSTNNQDGIDSSIQLQIKRMEQYAYSKGLALAEVYTETGCGESTTRPEYIRMIERVMKDPQIAGILVGDFSRLSRKAYNFFRMKKSLADHGISIVSFVDTTDPE